jgi:hypothetical protein
MASEGTNIQAPVTAIQKIAQLIVQKESLEREQELQLEKIATLDDKNYSLPVKTRKELEDRIKKLENLETGLGEGFKDVLPKHYACLEQCKATISSLDSLNEKIQDIEEEIQKLEGAQPNIQADIRVGEIKMSRGHVGHDFHVLPDGTVVKSNIDIKTLEAAGGSVHIGPTTHIAVQHVHHIPPDLEANLSNSIAKKLQLLRQRVLDNKYVREELSTYIPALGAYSTRDRHSFDLDAEVQKFLSGEKTLLLLLGSAGSGKSIFNRYTEYKLWEAYQLNDPIPLFISLPSLQDPVHRLPEETLAYHGFTSREIEVLKQSYRFTFILDGYDEMNKLDNLYVTNHLENWQAKSIIACRTEYYTHILRGRKYFIPAIAERPNAAKFFQEVTVMPFSDTQISNYIRKYLEIHSADAHWQDPAEYEQHIDTIQELKELVRTPFLLMITMQAMPRIIEKYAHLQGEAQESITRANLYDIFITELFDREENKLMSRNELPKDGRDVIADFWKFSTELAAEMHAAKVTQVRYVPDRLELDFGHKQKVKKEDPWEKYFSDKDPNIARARRSGVLRELENHWHTFMHPTLVSYFFGVHMGTQLLEEEVNLPVEEASTAAQLETLLLSELPHPPDIQVSAQAVQTVGHFAPAAQAPNSEKPALVPEPEPAASPPSSPPPEESKSRCSLM